MRRLADLQERGAPARRATADPKWMQDALKAAGLYDDMMDAMGLRSKPAEGDEEAAARYLFLKKVKAAFGAPSKQIPVEVYYELEDSNYHTANEFLDTAGYYDASYGERQDKWRAEREGIKPMWGR